MRIMTIATVSHYNHLSDCPVSYIGIHTAVHRTLARFARSFPCFAARAIPQGPSACRPQRSMPLPMRDSVSSRARPGSCQRLCNHCGAEEHLGAVPAVRARAACGRKLLQPTRPQRRRPYCLPEVRPVRLPTTSRGSRKTSHFRHVWSTRLQKRLRMIEPGESGCSSGSGAIRSYGVTFTWSEYPAATTKLTILHAPRRMAKAPGSQALRPTRRLTTCRN